MKQMDTEWSEFSGSGGYPDRITKDGKMYDIKTTSARSKQGPVEPGAWHRLWNIIKVLIAIAVIAIAVIAAVGGIIQNW